MCSPCQCPAFAGFMLRWQSTTPPSCGSRARGAGFHRKPCDDAARTGLQRWSLSTGAWAGWLRPGQALPRVHDVRVQPFMSVTQAGIHPATKPFSRCTRRIKVRALHGGVADLAHGDQERLGPRASSQRALRAYDDDEDGCLVYLGGGPPGAATSTSARAATTLRGRVPPCEAARRRTPHTVCPCVWLATPRTRRDVGDDRRPRRKAGRCWKRAPRPRHRCGASSCHLRRQPGLTPPAGAFGWRSLD